MSLVRASRMTDKVTVWRESTYDAENPYGDGWELVGTYSCSYLEGGKMQRDDQGADFSPMKTVRLWGQTVEYGDRVVIGESSEATPPDNSEKVRGKKTGTMLTGATDFTFYTG